MRYLVSMAVLAFLACGGGSATDSPEPAGPPTASAPAVEAPGGAGQPSAVNDPATPVRTLTAAEVPDPCRLLTTEDARGLLGEPVGEPHAMDVGGIPCVYDAVSGEGQVVLDMTLDRHLAVEETQLGITVDYCDGEVVARPEDLGVDAALFHMRKEDCAPDTLWVSTGVYFEGTERDMMTGRAPEGYIHLTYTVEPTPDRETLLDRMSAAARRGLDRLPR